MSGRAERLERLRRRGELERDRLADSVAEISDEAARRRRAWKITGRIAAGLAAAGTVAYKLLGKASPAARLGRAASAASVLLGLARAFLRLRRQF